MQAIIILFYEKIKDISVNDFLSYYNFKSHFEF